MIKKYSHATRNLIYYIIVLVNKLEDHPIYENECRDNPNFDNTTDGFIFDPKKYVKNNGSSYSSGKDLLNDLRRLAFDGYIDVNVKNDKIEITMPFKDFYIFDLNFSKPNTKKFPKGNHCIFSFESSQIKYFPFTKEPDVDDRQLVFCKKMGAVIKRDRGSLQCEKVAFLSYWAEIDPSMMYMRCELLETFDIKAEWEKWDKKDSDIYKLMTSLDFQILFHFKATDL